MSRDLFVQDIPPGARTVADIPGDFAPCDIGERSSIIAAIRRVVPDADFSDPSWGNLEGPDYSIEVNLGDEGPCTSFALHVQGGDTAAFVVHEILKLNSPNLWQSLISFNIGVEIGQLGIVVLVWPLFWYLARRGDKPVNLARWSVALPCMAFAAVWAGERFRLLLPAL